MVPGLLLSSIRVPITLHSCWWFAYLSLPLKLEVLWDTVEFSTWELRSGYGVRPVFASLLHRYCVTLGKFLHFLCLSFYTWKTGIGTVPVFIKVCVLGDPIVHSKVWLFMRRTHRTQHIVLLSAIIYYGERIQSIIHKGKRCMGQSLEETRHELPRVFSQWSYIGHT